MMRFRLTSLLLLLSTSTTTALRGSRRLDEGMDDDDYMGCLCPCNLPDGQEGVLIHTYDTAIMAEAQVQGAEEKIEASHVLCVDDTLSIEFITQGKGTCDEECFLKSDDNELSTGVDDEYEMDDDGDMGDDFVAGGDDDEYALDESGDDEYGDDESGDDEYANDEYEDDEYADDEYGDDGYADDEYGDDRYADDEFGDDGFGDNYGAEGDDEFVERDDDAADDYAGDDYSDGDDRR